MRPAPWGGRRPAAPSPVAVRVAKALERRNTLPGTMAGLLEEADRAAAATAAAHPRPRPAVAAADGAAQAVVHVEAAGVAAAEVVAAAVTADPRRDAGLLLARRRRSTSSNELLSEGGRAMLAWSVGRAVGAAMMLA